MGSVTYNFLADSLFFNKTSLKNRFKNESEQRIEKELAEYRKHCVENQAALVKEIQDKDSSLKVFSSAGKTQLQLLKQTALYVDQFVIYDPLFKFTDFQSDMAKLTGEYLGYKQGGLQKDKLWEAASFMKEVTPMVAANYLKVFPLSYHFEAPKTVPVTMPTDYYNGILPKQILEFFWENVEVSSMMKVEDEGWIIDESRLYPCRGIVVDFKGDYSSSMIYHLMEMEVLQYDEATGKAKIRQTLPDTIPDTDHFNAWVTQSINKSSQVYFDRIYNEVFIASNLRSTYLCDNPFTDKLLKRNFGASESISTFTASQIMNLDLPFLEKINIEKLMHIRNNDAGVFTNFRIELEKSFRELRKETDEKIIKQKTENIMHELNVVQGQKIRNKINHVVQQFAIDATLLMGGLVGSMQKSELGLLAIASAAIKGYKDFTEYREKVKENPAYFLWKVQR